ncbi:MAG: methyl-accepting chemotaxis protein [Desulfomicrobium sp.]|nr:methyl-accepting chemotaxis protein [Pseudomonadota bacterium]MBV1713220.1 methyl-accepting chemotaxis protein [Desulfomicrobium sp.]MBU4571324.1 methyl-accepting chemotaxis protein [Pseudomonadota bacterium]MBU4595586.1 methyl-accepting chemotaxis protein [Pseudomonadota bacterium]MBV1720028.1 methyl-accepting chemotaxis protein [Desulfomicrobium sp.]
MKNIPIRMKLIGGFLALLILVCSGLGFIAYDRAKNASLNQVQENIQLMAQDGARLVRSKLDFYILGLEGIANRDVIRSMNWDRQMMAMERETERMNYLGMGVIDASGQAKYPDGTTADLSDREYFKEAMAGKSVLSNVIISRVTNSPVIILATPIKGFAGDVKAVLLARLDATMLSETTDNIKYGQSGYSYIIDDKGVLIAHSNRQFVLDQRNFLEEGKKDAQFARLSIMFQRMIKGEIGFDQYPFMGSDRFFGFAPIEGSGWSIAVGAMQDDVLDDIYQMRWMIGLASLAFFVVGIIIALMISRAILLPVRNCVNLLKDISEGEGDLTKRLPVDSKDEIGQLGLYFNTFVEKLQRIIAEISGNAQTVASSATQLSAVSKQTTQSVQSLSSKTSTVATAAEEMSANITSVAAGMEETTTNLSSVAAATEEMTSTIGEISVNTERARGTTDSAARQVDNFAGILRDLGASAQEIGKVTDTISAISSQTNLLALNATIEAARAGDAGRGFAVVANEIKELALKTAEATNDIRTKINGIQTASGSAVTDIGQIVKVIGDVNDIVTTIAAAIEEQSAVTREVATNINQATTGVQDASVRASEMSGVSRDIAQDITAVDSITGDIRSGGEQVEASAEELSKLAEQLKGLVGQFKI